MKFRDILDYAIGDFTVGKILAAVITFVICYLVIKVIFSLLSKVIDKTSLDIALKRYIKTGIKIILWFVTAIITVDALGVSTTSFVAAFSVVGLAASLAVQDSLSNLASGFMLLVTKPFKIGDFVEIDGVTGTVNIISLIHTKLLTADNKMVYVPNGKVISAKIVNYTTEAQRRVDIEISASYDAPISTVREALLKAVEKTELFEETPEKPFAAVLSYDDSSIRYVVKAWTMTDKYWQAYYALNEEIKTEFDEYGIEMTYNHINVHMIEDKKNR